MPVFAAVALHDLWHRLWVALGVRESAVTLWLGGRCSVSILSYSCSFGRRYKH